MANGTRLARFSTVLTIALVAQLFTAIPQANANPLIAMAIGAGLGVFNGILEAAYAVSTLGFEGLMNVYAALRNQPLPYNHQGGFNNNGNFRDAINGIMGTGVNNYDNNAISSGIAGGIRNGVKSAASMLGGLVGMGGAGAGGINGILGNLGNLGGTLSGALGNMGGALRGVGGTMGNVGGGLSMSASMTSRAFNEELQNSLKEHPKEDIEGEWSEVKKVMAAPHKDGHELLGHLSAAAPKLAGAIRKAFNAGQKELKDNLKAMQASDSIHPTAKQLISSVSAANDNVVDRLSIKPLSAKQKEQWSKLRNQQQYNPNQNWYGNILSLLRMFF